MNAPLPWSPWRHLHGQGRIYLLITPDHRGTVRLNTRNNDACAIPVRVRAIALDLRDLPGVMG